MGTRGEGMTGEDSPERRQERQGQDKRAWTGDKEQKHFVRSQIERGKNKVTVFGRWSLQGLI